MKAINSSLFNSFLEIMVWYSVRNCVENPWVFVNPWYHWSFQKSPWVSRLTVSFNNYDFLRKLWIFELQFLTVKYLIEIHFLCNEYFWYHCLVLKVLSKKEHEIHENLFAFLWVSFSTVWSSSVVFLGFCLVYTAKNTVTSPNFLVWNCGDSPETMQKLCLSTKFPHQEIRWSHAIFRIGRCLRSTQILLSNYYTKYCDIQKKYRKCKEQLFRRGISLMIFWYFSAFLLTRSILLAAVVQIYIDWWLLRGYK